MSDAELMIARSQRGRAQGCKVSHSPPFYARLFFFLSFVFKGIQTCELLSSYRTSICNTIGKRHPSPTPLAFPSTRLTLSHGLIRSFFLSLSFTISPPRIFFLIRFGDCRVRNGGDDAIGCRKTACHLAPERMMVRAALPLCLGGANV